MMGLALVTAHAKPTILLTLTAKAALQSTTVFHRTVDATRFVCMTALVLATARATQITR